MEYIYILGVYRPKLFSSPLIIATFDKDVKFSMIDAMLKQHGYSLSGTKMNLLGIDGVAPCHENGQEQWIMFVKHEVNTKVVWPPEPELHAPLKGTLESIDQQGPGSFVFNGSEPISGGSLSIDGVHVGQATNLTVELKKDPTPPYEGAL